MDYNALVRAHLNLRNAKSEVRRKADAEVKALQDQQDKIEAVMLAILAKGDGEGIRTKSGTFYRQEEVMPSARDWEAFYDWIKDNDAFDALERRIKRTFITAYMEAHKGELPPGVSVFRQFKIGVRKNAGADGYAGEDDEAA